MPSRPGPARRTRLVRTGLPLALAATLIAPVGASAQSGPTTLDFADAVLPPDASGVIVSGDFNGDGVDDLMTTAPGDGNDLRWNGTGGDRFLDYGDQAWEIRGGFDLIASGDFDGDGDTDLWLINEGRDNDRMLLADGDNSFDSQGRQSVDVRDPYWGLLVGDYNGDGRDDVYLLSPSPGRNRMLASRGANAFDSLGSRSLQIRYGYEYFVPGDYDGDGRTDLWLHNEGLDNDRMLVATGGFGFASLGWDSFDVGNDYFDISAADHSGDGRDDLVLMGPRLGEDRRFNSTGRNRFTGFGRGSYRFEAALSFSIAGDYDGDGLVDLFLVGEPGDDRVMTSTGANGFFDHRAGAAPPRTEGSPGPQRHLRTSGSSMSAD